MCPKLTWLAPLAIIAAFPPAGDAESLVAITEILKDPAGGESDCPGGACLEMVEITNFGPDPLSADHLFLTDGVTVDSILPWPEALAEDAVVVTGQDTLPPGRTAVIADPQYTDAPRHSRFTLADSTRLWTVDHVSIAGGLSRDRGLLLYRGSRGRIDDSLAAVLDPGQAGRLGMRLTHTMPASSREGHSLHPTHVLFAGSRWIPSADTVTAGIWPSLEHGWLLEHRPGITSARATTIPCTIAVHHVSGIIPEGTRWRLGRTGSPITVIEEPLSGRPSPYRIVIDLPKDTVRYLLEVDHEGGRLRQPVDLSTVWLPPSPIRITEISPRATDELPEWIEITNISAIPVDLHGWRLGTPEASDTISALPLSIEPGEYLVLTRDRELFTTTYAVAVRSVEPLHWQALDNYHDTLHLWSPLDTLAAETVIYDHRWFDEWGYQSLARIDPAHPAIDRDAWAVATTPSPGQPDAAVSWRAVRAPSLSIGPTPFTPNGDGRDELLAVRLRLPATHHATVSIYGFDGDILYRFPAPPKERRYWDGMTDSNRPAPVGPFFVVAEITAGGTKERIRAKGILWR
jgi:hypothetical protein